jgi:hypothetical protein
MALERPPPSLHFVQNFVKISQLAQNLKNIREPGVHKFWQTGHTAD